MSQQRPHTWSRHILVPLGNKVGARAGGHVEGGGLEALGQGLVVWGVSPWARSKAGPASGCGCGDACMCDEANSS